MKVREILKGRTKWLPNKKYDEVTPMVSVLLPTWKRAKSGLFKEAVESVLNQSFSNLELIIVDDCSTDGTFDIIKNFMENDNRVNCIRHVQNIGLPAISECEAFEKARGEYITWIFDDNEWKQDGIKELLSELSEKNGDAIAGKYLLFDGKVGDKLDDENNWKLLGGKCTNIADLWNGNYFANGATIVKKNVLDDVGFFDPNVVLSRLWDWDLWLRIAKKYSFIMSDVTVGKEKGVGLADSLGNTVKLYMWAAQERMRQDRDVLLKGKNYLDVDVFDLLPGSSPHLCQSNLWLSKQYTSKPWFDANDISLKRLKEMSKSEWEGKRVLYLSASMHVNASETLIWTRLPQSANYTVLFSSLLFYDYLNWSFADVIILERELNPDRIKPLLDWAKGREIPVYFYVDDNYQAIANDFKNNTLFAEYQKLGELFNPKTLSDFKGIFVSTEKLKEYFVQHDLHNEINVIEPIFDENLVSGFNADSNNGINIAFLGNFVRAEILIKVVLPALSKIKIDNTLNLYCPSDVFEMIKNSLGDKCVDRGRGMYSYNSIMMRSFERTLSLEQLLLELRKLNINIQVHCSTLLENNEFKTYNALLNSVCLGATLIASNCYPYSELEERVCLLADNTIESWEATLKKALDSNVRKNLYQNAEKYCRIKYDGQKAQNTLEKCFSKLQSFSLGDDTERLIDHISYLGKLLSSNVSVNSNGMLAESSCSSLTSLFLNTLSNAQIKKLLRNKYPLFYEKAKIKAGTRIQLSRPYENNEYIEFDVIPRSVVQIMILASEAMPILFEFVDSNRIVKQSVVEIGDCEFTDIEIPQGERMKLRVATLSKKGSFQVLIRRWAYKHKYVVALREGK